MKKIFRPFKRIFWDISDSILYRIKRQTDVLYAFYDLQVSPPDFDFVVFLVLAEQARIEANCESLHIVIVPGPDEGFRKGSDRTFNAKPDEYVGLLTKEEQTNYRRWLLNNILIPCCHLIPACKSITVCGSISEARVFQSCLAKNIFPTKSTIRYPKENYLIKHVILRKNQSPLPSLRATPKAIQLINGWIENNANGRKVITISLREMEDHPERNSSLKDWAKFANDINQKIYFPVILRDTEKDFDSIPKELEGLKIFHQVVWNIELRAAIYELSYLNLCVDNGISTLLIFNEKARYLFFGESPFFPDQMKIYLKAGNKIGQSYPWATPYQKLVWEKDVYTTIKSEFESMCRKIDNST